MMMNLKNTQAQAPALTLFILHSLVAFQDNMTLLMQYLALLEFQLPVNKTYFAWHGIATLSPTHTTTHNLIMVCHSVRAVL